MKKALIFQGGWQGHEPALVAKRIEGILAAEGFTVEIHDTLDCLLDMDNLLAQDLIIPIWTGGTLPRECSANVAKAVGAGVGLAGCHGGMCDAFNADTEWQFMTGGQWVSHPGGDGVEYMVNIASCSNPITAGIVDFPVKSEHYYLHVDPAVEVLATTRLPLISYYHISNKPIDMPVVWTKMWGLGRVFYSALGHQDNVFDNSPSAQELLKRGMIWASGGKQYAADNGLTVDRFINEAKMY